MGNLKKETGDYECRRAYGVRSTQLWINPFKNEIKKLLVNPLLD